MELKLLCRDDSPEPPKVHSAFAWVAANPNAASEVSRRMETLFVTPAPTNECFPIGEHGVFFE
jgi:hypothetical protein